MSDHILEELVGKTIAHAVGTDGDLLADDEITFIFTDETSLTVHTGSDFPSATRLTLQWGGGHAWGMDEVELWQEDARD